MENINGWMDSLKRTYQLFLEQNENVTFEDFRTRVIKKIKMNEEKEIILISDAEEDDSVIIFFYM